MTREKAVTLIEKYFEDGEFERDLNRRVGYKTQSNDKKFQPELFSYLKMEMVPYLTEIGFECEIHDNPCKDAGPILVAIRKENSNYPTVMTYGHGDVIDGYDGQWLDGINPWTVTKRNDHWYGRGTADNKAQHTINLAALRAVINARGKLGFNVVVLIEMAEERGSAGLREFCQTNKNLFEADVFIASDGPRIQPDMPTIFMGSRGVFNFTMRLDVHKNGHHSGNWGGLLTNPGIVMAHAIASMVDRNGKILVEGWRNTEMPDTVRHAIAKLAVGDGPNAPEINPNWGEPDMTPEERVFASNTFEIRAYETGVPQSPANAIPPSAVAYGHMRYVSGTDVNQLLPKLRIHLDKHGYNEIEIIADRDLMYATRLDPSHPWAQWILGSLSQTHGSDIAVIPNLGGSLPNDVFAEVLGLPTIWVPHSYAGCSQHAPNEHILEATTLSALRLMTGLWWDLGCGETPDRSA